MAEKTEMNCEFLRKRMEEFRKINKLSLEDMAQKIIDRRKEINSKRRKDIKEENSKKEEKNSLDRSTLYRAEIGDTGIKKVRKFYSDYWKALYDPEGFLDIDINSLNNEEKEKRRKLERDLYIFQRGERVVVVDISAIKRNTNLIDELAIEYSKVIIPNIVIKKLEESVDGKQARAVLEKINKKVEDSPANIVIDNTCKAEDAYSIIKLGENASKYYNCIVEIIVDNDEFVRILSNNDAIKALTISEYKENKQTILNIESLKKLNDDYADSYDNYDNKDAPNGSDINASLPDGNRLIISAVINKDKPLNQRKEKIKWLIANGAKVDRRDIGSKYMPALSHAILVDDFDMFKFLLEECKADPNCGSRNPFTSGKIRQDNEGVMPLMLAAEKNMSEYLKLLLKDKRTSINQQDGYGRTALIIASMNEAHTCIDLLKEAGADEKIVDRDGCTYKDRLKESLEH